MANESANPQDRPQQPPTTAQPPYQGPPAAPPPPPPPAVQQHFAMYQPPRRGCLRWLGRAILLLVLVGSLLLNVALMGQLHATMGGLDQRVLRNGDQHSVVAVYSLTGLITNEAAENFGAFAAHAIGDRAVKVVVLRIDSGGVLVAPSDEIYNSVRKIREAGKKVVVSMGGTAASGGYYAAAPADLIFAEHTTVTGSIGVFAGWPVLKGTMDKLGIRMVMVRSTDARAWKAAENPFEEPNDYQLAHVQEMLNAIQDRFEHVVRLGRGNRLRPRDVPLPPALAASMKAGTVTAVGTPPATQPTKETEPFNGKVYMAEAALELGLVDKIGYLSDAIDEAAKLAGLGRPKVIEYSPRKSLLAHLFSAQSGVNVDLKSIQEAQTPRIMMLWTEQ